MKGCWADMNVEEKYTAREMRDYEKLLLDLPVLGRELQNLGCKKNFLQEVFQIVPNQNEGVINVQCQDQVYYLWIKEEPGSVDVGELEVYHFDPIRN